MCLVLFLPFCLYYYTLYMCAVVLPRTGCKTSLQPKIVILDY